MRTHEQQRLAAQAAAWRRFQALLELDRRVRKNPNFLSLPPRVQPVTEAKSSRN